MADAPLDTNFDLGAAKTVLPLIADGTLARLKLTNLTVTSGDKGPTMKWEWDLTEPVRSSEGEDIRPGSFGAKIFENIAMYVGEGKNPAWFVERVAKRVDGLLGTSDPGNRKGKPARPSVDMNPVNATSSIPQLATQLVGKEIVAKIKIRTTDYGPQNDIQTVTFPGDISA